MEPPIIISESFLSRLKNKDILLFLSATSFREKYCNLPYDYVILNNENFVSTEQGSDKILLFGGKVIVMPFHNYTAIRMLWERQLRIKAFVGIDAYQHHAGECFNSISFFSKIGPILNQVVHYITDDIYDDRHDGKKEPGFLNVNYEVYDAIDRYYSYPDHTHYFIDFFGDIFDVTCLMISKIVERNWEAKFGRIAFSEINGNVFDHMDKYQCLIIDGLSEPDFLFPHPKKADNFLISLDDVIHFPFQKLLELADQNKWNSIGFSCPPDTDYYRIYLACKDWESDYPSRLDFYRISCNLSQDEKKFDEFDYLRSRGLW